MSKATDDTDENRTEIRVQLPGAVQDEVRDLLQDVGGTIELIEGVQASRWALLRGGRSSPPCRAAPDKWLFLSARLCPESCRVLPRWRLRRESRQ